MKTHDYCTFTVTFWHDNNNDNDNNGDGEDDVE